MRSQTLTEKLSSLRLADLSKMVEVCVYVCVHFSFCFTLVFISIKFV